MLIKTNPQTKIDETSQFVFQTEIRTKLTTYKAPIFAEEKKKSISPNLREGERGVVNET